MKKKEKNKKKILIQYVMETILQNVAAGWVL